MTAQTQQSTTPADAIRMHGMAPVPVHIWCETCGETIVSRDLNWIEDQRKNHPCRKGRPS